MRTRRLLDGGLALVIVVSLGGCHRYVPVQHFAPGTVVRVQVPLTSAVEGSTQAPEIRPTVFHIRHFQRKTIS